MTTACLTHQLNNLAITMIDQGARGSHTSWQLQIPALTHLSSQPLDPSFTEDHCSDTASDVTTVAYHHQDGNLIPLLPWYYQLDFDCFVDKVGNQLCDGAVILVNSFQFRYLEALNHLEVCTGIPIPALYMAQPADFDILLIHLPNRTPQPP